MTRYTIPLLIVSTILLAGCNEAPVSIARGADEPIMDRRLWASEGGSRPPLVEAILSEDGRYALAHLDEGLGIMDFQDGSIAALDLGADASVCQVLALPPGGDRIAYAKWDPDLDNCAVWISDLEFASGVGSTTNHRQIQSLPEPSITWPWTFGWSERDEILTVVFNQESRRPGLALASASNDELRIVKELDQRDFNAAINADGDLIAYDVLPLPENPEERDIYLLADESRETPLVTGPGNDSVLGWLPGSDDLFFLSDRNGSLGIWRLPMSGEVVIGSPELMKELDAAIEPVELRGDAFYFGARLDASKVALGRLDPATGELVEEGAPLEHTSGRITAMDWSPDGELFAHDSWGDNGSIFDVILRTAQGEFVKAFDFDDMSMQSGALRWMPDGQSLLFKARASSGHDAIVRLDLATGEHESLRIFESGEWPSGETGDFSVDPTSSTLAFFLSGRADDGTVARLSIVLRDLATGAERTIFHPANSGSLEFSPDGRWLAVQVNSGPWPVVVDPGGSPPGTLLLLPADGGGDPITLYEGDITRIAGWSADSSWLYVRFRNGNPDQPIKLWKVQVPGGELQSLPGVERPSRIHPDGETIAYREPATVFEYRAITGLVDAPGGNAQ